MIRTHTSNRFSLTCLSNPPALVRNSSFHNSTITSLRLTHSDSALGHLDLIQTFTRPQFRASSLRLLSPPVSQKRHTALQAITGDAGTMDVYTFPDARLRKKMDNPFKTPLLLIACGSFSPITFLHLRMFIMAADYVKFGTDGTEFEIIGGYLSPVSDAYKKQGLATAEHRYDD